METNQSRMDDMVERYGEVCTQKVAGQILNVVPRTIHRIWIRRWPSATVQLHRSSS